MKIAVIGYSGSGKSTLARKLGEIYDLPVLHLDKVHWMPGWKGRSFEDKNEIIRDFLDAHTNDGWVMDGNYERFFFDRRMEEADRIVFFNFSRLNCLWRVFRRYRKYRGQTREDMGEGCPEKLDWEFVRWILRDGRTAKHRKRYAAVLTKYPEKCIVLKNQCQLTKLYGTLHENNPRISISPF